MQEFREFLASVAPGHRLPFSIIQQPQAKLPRPCLTFPHPDPHIPPSPPSFQDCEQRLHLALSLCTQKEAAEPLFSGIEIGTETMVFFGVCGVKGHRVQDDTGLGLVSQ